MGIAMVLIGMLGAAVSLIMLIINAIKKKPKKNAGIALAACVGLLIVGALITPPSESNAKEPTQTETPAETETPKQTETPAETEAPKQTEKPVQTEEPNQSNDANDAEESDADYAVINSFIEQYNKIADVPITDPVKMELKDPTFYRTEYRLTAFRNAVAKRCSIGDATIDIVNFGSLKNDEIRFYLITDDEEFAIQVFKNAVSIFDPDLTEEEIEEAVDDIKIEERGFIKDITYYYISSYRELFVDNSNIDFYKEK